jgi:hypothetical protein
MARPESDTQKSHAKNVWLVKTKAKCYAYMLQSVNDKSSGY